MSSKDIAYDQVFIDMKTKITIYGPHNGIIVYCGVQQEPSMCWPYILNDAPNSLSIQQFDAAAPTFATIHWPTAVEENGDNGRNKSATCMPNQHYQLAPKDGTSDDNFSAFEKVRLNLFETNPTIAKIRSFDMVSSAGSNYKSDLNSTIPQISNSNISNMRKPLSVTQNVNYHRDIEKTSKNDVSNDEMRLKSVINSWNDVQQPISSTRINSNLIPMQESFEKTATNCGYYSDHHNDEIAKYDYNQIEKEFANDISLRKIPLITNDSKIIDKSTNGQRKKNDRRFLEHLAGSFAYSSSNQQQQYRSTTDLCEVQMNHSKVPEQLYHLYETQDAFGNLLEQL
ncbi:hypothetical protein ACH3XW_11110 [Acanthocheilonema viteae]